MRNALPCLVVLTGLVADLGAQDLEPTLDRGVRRAVEALALALPARDPSPEGLALDPDGSVSVATMRALERELTAHGYRVTRRGSLVSHGRGTVLRLEVREESRPPHRAIVLSDADSDFSVIVAFGGADWVDSGEPDLLVVEGPLNVDRAAAVQAAWEKAARLLTGKNDVQATLRSLPRGSRVFSSEARSEAGIVFYRAYLGIENAPRLARTFERDHRRAQRGAAMAPILRGLVSVLLVATLGLGYLVADLRTRGYATTPLRLLFGLIGLIGVAACWRIGA